MNRQKRMRPSTSWMRIVGVLLLVFLLYRLDSGEIGKLLVEVDLRQSAIAALLIFPLIGLKTLRWQLLLKSQSINYKFTPALTAYFASVFAGFITPGRLGEFIKTFYLSNDLGITRGKAFSSVLIDRLFDLFVLLIVGWVALTELKLSGSPLLALRIGTVLSLVLIFLIFSPRMLVVVAWMRRLLGRFGYNAPGMWLLDLQQGLQSLSPGRILVALFITVLSYGVYFGQCALLASAIGLDIGFVPVTYAVALGSLVTLLPVSISGLGTREATITLYLGVFGVAPEPALSFSLLVFTLFYIVGGLIGFLAWLVKPLEVNAYSEQIQD